MRSIYFFRSKACYRFLTVFIRERFMASLTHHWIRKLTESRKPAYLLIPELIEEDLASGRLRPRDRLPGLRDLADELQLNYTTVARAYAEARKRGLLDSRAGSGTFVRGRTATLPLSGGSSVEMTMYMPPEPAELAARLRDSAARLFSATDPYRLLRYQDFGGTAEDRAAGTKWLKRRFDDCDEDKLLVCPGIHSALVALVSQLARPGGTICLDTLAYPGIKAIAAQLGVRLQALARDDDGPLAHAFEALCKRDKPSAFYCNPTIQNPSTVTLSSKRREALADVALRYSVPIIEDDAYGMLPVQAPDALATLAPDLTYYVTGFSKSFGAGLRVAYIRAPSARRSQHLAGAMRAESAARQELAASVLSNWKFDADPAGFHLWMPIPTECGWNASELALQLRSRGIGAVSAAAFATDGNPPEAIRVCLGGPKNLDECEDALRLIADTVEHPHHLHLPVM